MSVSLLQVTVHCYVNAYFQFPCYFIDFCNIFKESYSYSHIWKITIILTSKIQIFKNYMFFSYLGHKSPDFFVLVGCTAGIQSETNCFCAARIQSENKCSEIAVGMWSLRVSMRVPSEEENTRFFLNLKSQQKTTVWKVKLSKFKFLKRDIFFYIQ